MMALWTPASSMAASISSALTTGTGRWSWLGVPDDQMWIWASVMRIFRIFQKDSTFSVDKEAKRLSSICAARAERTDKNFLVLFFKKELLTYFCCPDTPSTPP
jgi:hypothetical protein